MKNTARFLFLLGVSSLTLAAASKKALPEALKCDFLLSRMTVDFENMGPVWNSADSAVIQGLELNSRAANNDRVIITLVNDKNRAVHYIRPEARLDALLIEHHSLFKNSMLSATVLTNGLLRARIESSRKGGADSDVTPLFAIVDDVDLAANEKFLKIETWRNRAAGGNSLALTLDRAKPIRFLLRSETDALIFLAARKLGLKTSLKSHAVDTGAFKEQGYPYSAIAGSLYYGKYHTALPEVLDIGTDFVIQGIEQYRSSEAAEGHTEIYLMRNSDKRSIKLISADYENGMQALEMAAGAKAFKIKVTQYEALPGDTQNNETVNKFEMLK